MNEENVLNSVPQNVQKPEGNHIEVPGIDMSKKDEQKPQKQQTLLVLNVQSDWGGQGIIRNVWPFTTLNMIYGPRKQIITQWENLYPISLRDLTSAHTLWLQRQSDPSQVEFIKEIARNRNQIGGLKMIMDNDDLIWGFNEKMGGDKKHGIPSWNPAYSHYNEVLQNSSIEGMSCMDLLSFSTKFLGEYVHQELGVEVPYEIVPNTVPWAYWGRVRRPHIEETIKKPKVIYTGAPQHYNNQEKTMGDWANRNWVRWVKNSVNAGKIDFYCIGGLPHFFEPIKDKIKVYPWVEIFNLHLIIKDIQPDFCINPLYNCDFNKGKSDLKLVECCAAGMVCVGTVFEKDIWKGPYEEAPIRLPEDCTESDIEGEIRKACEPEEFNRILDYQYKWIEDNGRYTEHPKFINNLVKVLV